VAGKSGGKKVIKPKPGSGQKAVSFQQGGLHQSLGVPAGQPIPAAKMQAALSGKKGPKAKAQANFAVNVLGMKKPSGAAKPVAGKKGASRGK
jgi:hypothetical protein